MSEELEKKEDLEQELSAEEKALLAEQEGKPSESTEQEGQENVEHEKQPEVTAEDNQGEEEETEKVKAEEKQEDEIDLDALDNFDAVHKLYEEDRQKFYKLPKAVTSQYHNAKGFYKKVKEYEAAEKKRKEHDTIREGVADQRIKQALQALADENITVERLQAILGGQPQQETDADRPLTVQEFQRMQKESQEKTQSEQSKQQEIASRINDVDMMAAVRLGGKEEADAMVQAAKQAMDSYDIEKLTNMIQGETFNPETVYGFLERFARIGGYSREGNKERQQPKKQRSSAMVGGGNGTARSKDDLTPEDVAKMSPEQFNKLDDTTRARILSMV